MVEAEAKTPGAHRTRKRAEQRFRPVQLGAAALQIGAEHRHKFVVVGIGRQLPQLQSEGIKHLAQQPIHRPVHLLQPKIEGRISINGPAAAATAMGGWRPMGRLGAAVVALAGLLVAQLFPGGIEGNDPGAITSAGIGMVLFHQGSIGRLNFRGGGPPAHPKYPIGIRRGHGRASVNIGVLR